VLGSENTGIRNYSEPLGCAGMPEGCGTTVRNVAILDSSSVGVSTTGPGPDLWIVGRSVLAGNGTEVLPGEPVDDDRGVVRNSSTARPPEIGLESGQCLVYVPEGSALKGAGAGGADIGANVLYRYEYGVLTDWPLWDPQTSRFPCGATKAGVTGEDFESCLGLNFWFNAGSGGCELPTQGVDPCE
jgi:hypothetical protein